MDDVQHAVQKCPFLHSLALEHGPAYAVHFATQGALPFAQRPVLKEETCGFRALQATYQLFHVGPAAPVPLAGRTGAACSEGNNWLKRPSTSGKGVSNVIRPASDGSRPKPLVYRRLHPLHGAPFASLSLSFGFGVGAGKWWRGSRRRKRGRRHQSQDAERASDSSGQQQQQRLRPAGQDSAAGRRAGPFRSGRFRPVSSLLAAGTAGQLKCPAAVVAARAAVARLPAVQRLRPQALPVRLLAVGAFTGVANAPSGAARAHTRKFSPEWFLAVHFAVPFIAMLRKACLMPPWAIAYTIAAAIAGQVVGNRLEQMRMAGRLTLPSFGKVAHRLSSSQQHRHWGSGSRAVL